MSMDGDIRGLREQLAAARAERSVLERRLAGAAVVRAGIEAARRDADAVSSPALRASRDRAATLRSRLRGSWRSVDAVRVRYQRLVAAAGDPMSPVAAAGKELAAVAGALESEAAVRRECAALLEAAGSSLQVPAPVVGWKGAGGGAR